MEIEPLEVYARAANDAVIKPSGRHHPGCVIRGDSLRILCGAAVRVARRVRDHAPQDEEFPGDLEGLVHSLVDRLLHHQAVLQKYGIELP